MGCIHTRQEYLTFPTIMHVMTTVYEVLRSIDLNVNNIDFPLVDEEKLRKLEQGFMHICGGKFPGTVAAGDGVVFRMDRPTKEETNGEVAHSSPVRDSMLMECKHLLTPLAGS